MLFSPILPVHRTGPRCENIFQFILISFLIICISAKSLSAVDSTSCIALPLVLSSYPCCHPPQRPFKISPRSFWIWSKLLNLVTEILIDLASPNALASTVINPLSTLFVWAILNSIQQTVFKPLFLSFCCAPRARNASSTFSLLFSIPDSAPLKRLSTLTSSLKSLLCSAQKFITACLPQPSSLLLMMLLLIL